MQIVQLRTRAILLRTRECVSVQIGRRNRGSAARPTSTPNTVVNWAGKKQVERETVRCGGREWTDDGHTGFAVDGIDDDVMCGRDLAVM